MFYDDVNKIKGYLIYDKVTDIIYIVFRGSVTIKSLILGE